MTKRQYWARNRNWLLLRLRGALSIFSYNNKEKIESLISTQKAQRLYMIESDLKYLIKEISKSKWSGDE